MDFAYQDDGIAFHRARARSINLDEPGLGKTRQALMSAEGRTLVVAPGILRDMRVWEDERDKWAPDLDITVCSYHDLVEKETTWRPGKPTRKRGAKTVVNLKKLPTSTFTSRLNPVWRQHWDTVIYDEAHHLKGRKSHWSNAAEKLQSDKTIMLTGTPIPNWAFELYMLLRQLRPEDVYPRGPLNAYWRWVEKHFTVAPLTTKDGRVLSQFHTDGVLSACTPSCSATLTLGGCEHWETFRRQELGDLWIRRLRDDVLDDLPPLLGGDDQHVVPMHPKQKAAYDKLKKDMLVLLDNGEDIVAWNKGGLLVKLRQLSCGLEAVSSLEASGKLDAMCELLNGRARPALVVASYHASMDAIERRLDKMGLKWAEVSGRYPDATSRLAAKDAFQSGRIDVMVGQVETVSEGLTLTAGDMLIMVEQSWRPITNTQVMRRLHRPGQERPVTVVRLVSPGVDENMQELLRHKTEHQIRALPPRAWRELLTAS